MFINNRLHFAALSALAAVGACAAFARADLYVSDGDRVVHYDNAGTVLGTIDIAGATGLSFGPDGLLYIATNQPSSVYRFNPSTGAQIGGAFIPNSVTASENTQGPEGLVFGNDGNLYIADITASTVHIYTSAGVSVSAPTSAGLVQPHGISRDSGTGIYLTSNGIIERYDTSSHNFTDFTTSAHLNAPWDLAFGPDGKLYVLDISGSTPDVIRFNADGTYDATIISFLTPSLIDFFPAGITFGPDGKLYISGLNDIEPGGSVLRFLSDGTADGEFIAPDNVNSNDNLTFGASFLVFSPPSVPEPASLGLLLLGAPLLLRRRR